MVGMDKHGIHGAYFYAQLMTVLSMQHTNSTYVKNTNEPPVNTKYTPETQNYYKETAGNRTWKLQLNATHRYFLNNTGSPNNTEQKVFHYNSSCPEHDFW